MFIYEIKEYLYNPTLALLFFDLEIMLVVEISTTEFKKSDILFTWSSETSAFTALLKSSLETLGCY